MINWEEFLERQQEIIDALFEGLDSGPLQFDESSLMCAIALMAELGAIDRNQG